MKDLLVSVVTFGSGPAALFVVLRIINRFYDFLRENPNPDTLEKVAKYCESPSIERIHYLSDGLKNSFRELFGVGFTLRFLGISACFSLISVFLITLVWSLVEPQQYEQFLTNGFLSSLAALVLAAVLLNLLPDVISLWQTSIVVKLLQQSHASSNNYMVTVALTLLLVVVDVIITILLALLVIYLYSFLHEKSFMEIVSTAVSMQAVEPGSFTIGIFFYTTFATSIWVVFWLLSGILLYSGKAWIKLIEIWKLFRNYREDPFAPIFLSIKTIFVLLFCVMGMTNIEAWREFSAQYIELVVNESLE